jgi:hypothetical protein
VTAEPIDPMVIELAARVFDLARAGATDELAVYVDAGVPANLTNDKSDTLLVLAAYRDHPETVGALGRPAHCWTLPGSHEAPMR